MAIEREFPERYFCHFKVCRSQPHQCTGELAIYGVFGETTNQVSDLMRLHNNSPDTVTCGVDCNDNVARRAVTVMFPSRCKPDLRTLLTRQYAGRTAAFHREPVAAAIGMVSGGCGRKNGYL